MAPHSDAGHKTQPDADHMPRSCAERRMPFGVDRKAQPDSGNGRDFRHPSKPPCLILKHTESPAGTHLAAGESVATCTGARIAAVHNSDTADTDIKTTTEAHAGTRTGTADAKPGDVGASPNQMAHSALSGSIGLLGGMPRPQPSGDDRRKTRAPKNGKLECKRTERPYEEDR